MSSLLVFVATLTLGLLALWLATRIFPKIGLLDFPERYGLLRQRLPYPGGIVTVILTLCLLPWLLPFPTNIYLCSAIVLLGSVSFWDDRKRLPASLRLLAHVGVAALVVSGGMRVTAITNPLPGLLVDQGGSILLSSGPGFLLSIIFSVSWILLCINAMNWFDGIPGQVSTVSSIGFVTIGSLALSARVDQPHVATLAFCLAGLSLACALFEFPPPRMILGDSGAMFFGFLLAVLTIFSGGKVATGFLVLAIPLTDAAIVILRRLWRGVPVWRGNAVDEHLHHRLLHRGYSPRVVIALNTGLGMAFGISALFLSTTGKMIASGLLIGCITLLSLCVRPLRSCTT